MTVAFFDLDKTLISVNSANLWLKREWQKGSLNKQDLLKLSFGLLRYSFGLVNLEKDFRSAITMLKGRAYSKLESDGEKFYNTHIRNLYRPGALAALKYHQEQRHSIIILTTSPRLFARWPAKDLGVQHCISTELEVDEFGLCTGNPLGSLCYGKGKVELATRWLQQNGETLENSVFYSDSFTDKPMLEVVGHPVVVNPDPRLMRLATTRQWPIVDWGR